MARWGVAEFAAEPWAGKPVVLGLAHWAGAEIYLADLDPERRLEIVAALQSAGDEAGLPVFQVLAHSASVSTELVRLDIAQARWHAERAAELSRRYQLRQGSFISNVLRAMLAHVAGDLDQSDQLYEAEFVEQIRLGAVDIEAGRLIAISTVRYSQGRLGEQVDELRRAVAEVPTFLHILAFALAESGALDEARDVLAAAPALQRESLWQLYTAMRALTVAAVDDRQRAPELYEQLLPFAGQIAGGGTNGIVLVPVARPLGKLAVRLGRPEDARRHFEQALDVAERCGSGVWADQAHSDLADLEHHPVSSEPVGSVRRVGVQAQARDEDPRPQ